MAKEAKTVGSSTNGETVEANTQAKPPVVQDGKEVGANQVDLEATRDVVGERLDKLSEGNEEGHKVNMEKIEKAHEKNADADLSSGGMADGENRIGGAAPGLGREDNGNTPRIDEHGNKSWHPPGVAGAAR